MKITLLGHAAVLIEGSKTILIDPFLTNNPLASVTVEQLPKIDIVLVTHDHFDHFGDTPQILKRDDAILFAVHEVTIREDVASNTDKAVGANIGGTYEVDGVSLTLTPAIHSADNGVPSGYVIKIDGKTIYHSGDTALFGDMKLIPHLWGDIDLALVPIGGHYTMDVPAAVEAISTLKPKQVVPIHYNTWPPIEADTDDFVKRVHGSNVTILDPGQSIDL